MLQALAVGSNQLDRPKPRMLSTLQGLSAQRYEGNDGRLRSIAPQHNRAAQKARFVSPPNNRPDADRCILQLERR